MKQYDKAKSSWLTQAITTAVLVGATLLPSASNAKERPKQVCTVNFMATLNAGPAMKPTTVTFRNGGTVVLESKTHSLVTKTLDCGGVYRDNVGGGSNGN